jgi:hypothetical protein
LLDRGRYLFLHGADNRPTHEARCRHAAPASGTMNAGGEVARDAEMEASVESGNAIFCHAITPFKMA